MAHLPSANPISIISPPRTFTDLPTELRQRIFECVVLPVVIRQHIFDRLLHFRHTARRAVRQPFLGSYLDYCTVDQQEKARELWDDIAPYERAQVWQLVRLRQISRTMMMEMVHVEKKWVANRPLDLDAFKALINTKKGDTPGISIQICSKAFLPNSWHPPMALYDDGFDSLSNCWWIAIQHFADWMKESSTASGAPVIPEIHILFEHWHLKNADIFADHIEKITNKRCRARIHEINNEG